MCQYLHIRISIILSSHTCQRKQKNSPLKSFRIWIYFINLNRSTSRQALLFTHSVNDERKISAYELSSSNSCFFFGKIKFSKCIQSLSPSFILTGSVFILPFSPSIVRKYCQMVKIPTYSPLFTWYPENSVFVTLIEN